MSKYSDKLKRRAMEAAKSKPTLEESVEKREQGSDTSDGRLLGELKRTVEALKSLQSSVNSIDKRTREMLGAKETRGLQKSKIEGAHGLLSKAAKGIFKATEFLEDAYFHMVFDKSRWESGEKKTTAGD